MPKVLYLWIALFWTVLIAYFCLIPASTLPSVGIQYLDKVVHTCFHFFFTLFWFLFFKNRKGGEQFNRSLIMSFLLSVLFGVAIEIAQEVFTTTRNGDIIDVIANTTGALLAVVFMILTKKINKFI